MNETLVAMTPERIERFWLKVDKGCPGGCWEWTGVRKPSGYGVLSVTHIPIRAHRMAWLLTRGPAPAGLDLDHLCRNRACVNPEHLEPVTRKENLRRGIGHGSETHCPQDHAYVESNIYRERDGSRKCRTCVKARVARRANKLAKDRREAAA